MEINGIWCRGKLFTQDVRGPHQYEDDVLPVKEIYIVKIAAALSL